MRIHTISIRLIVTTCVLALCLEGSDSEKNVKKKWSHKMVYRGVLISWVGIEGFHCIQRCLHFRGLE